MSALRLHGLAIASPIGFMAALGLMRVLSEDCGLNPRLGWKQGSVELSGIDADALQRALLEHMQGRSEAPEFNFTVGAGSSSQPVAHLREIRPEEYRAAVQGMRDDARALGFMAGFGTDAVVNEKGFIARTAFDFSSANQKLAHEFRRLALRLDPRHKPPRGKPTSESLLHAALHGGPYAEQHSFGWDPATLMTHAHQPQAPTHAPTPGQPWLVWLAVESLPWHPVLPIDAQRAQTLGWQRSQTYCWPEWSSPLSAAELRLLRSRPVGTLGDLSGVTAVWQSARTSVGKFGFFAPAART
ncbi:MAG: hypothetical protein WDA70_10685 [Lysobacteraceae bacterium]